MTEDFATAVTETGRAAGAFVGGDPARRFVRRHADPLTTETAVDAVLAEARG